MLERHDARARCVDGVESSQHALADVHRHAELVLPRLINERCEDVRRLAVALHPVDPLFAEPAHVLARVLGRANDAAVVPVVAAARAGEVEVAVHVGEEARRNDAVGGAERLLLDAELDAAMAGRIARGGDAVRQPQLVDVLLRRLRPDVRVQVDESRQYPASATVDDALATPRRRCVDARRPDRDDAVALDDDVDRTFGGRSGAVDDHGAANRQALVGSAAAAVVLLCPDEAGQPAAGEPPEDRQPTHGKSRLLHHRIPFAALFLERLEPTNGDVRYCGHLALTSSCSST